MATVTGYTAAHMQEIEDSTVIDGNVVGGHLILVTRDATEIDAGSVIGPTGPSGGAFTICTSGTRPGSPTEGLAIYETDTDYIRVWNGTRWRLQEKIIGTHAARPTPVPADEGVKYYETDTDIEFTWTGTQWLSADNNVYVTTYTNAANRASLSPTPPVGALSYLLTTPGVLWIYESGVWNIVGDPPGSVKDFIGDTAPIGYVFMYGQTITSASTLYPILWSVIPSTWKSGTNLLVPDLRGRVVAGKEDMGGSAVSRVSIGGFNATILGSTGGDREPQQHNHTVTDGGHLHSTGETLEGPGAFGVVAGGKAISLQTASAISNVSVDDHFSGSSGNVQPSMALNKILKVL